MSLKTRRSGISPFQPRARPSGLSSLPAPKSLPERSPLAAFRRKREAMFRVGATAFKNGRVAWARRRTSPTDGFHPPLKRIPAIRNETRTTRQQNLPRASRRTACHRSLANHQIPFGYVGRVNFSTTIRFTVVFAYLSGSMLRCKTVRCLGVAWGGLATWCSSRIDSRMCAPIRQQGRTALRQHDQTQGALSC